MNKLKLLVLIALAISVITSLSGIANCQSGVQLTRLQGEVYYKTSGWWFFSASWQQVKKPVELEEGDQIKTSSNGKAELVFTDQAQVLIKPTSKVKLVKNKTGEIELKKLKLNLGEVVIKFIDQLDKESTFQVETPSAVAGIKGTTFKVTVNQDKETQVTVREGSVKVSSQVGAVTVNSGQAAQVTGKQKQPQVKPTPQSKNWQQEKQWLQKTQRWEKKVKQKQKQKEKKPQQVPPGQQKKQNKNSQSEKKSAPPGQEKEKPDKKKPNREKPEKENNNPDKPEPADENSNSDNKPEDTGNNKNKSQDKSSPPSNNNNKSNNRHSKGNNK